MFKHLLKLFPKHHCSFNIVQVPGQIFKQGKYSDLKKKNFSLSLESESGSNFVLIAVYVVFLSVLEEGSRPQVLHNKCFKISSSL